MDRRAFLKSGIFLTMSAAAAPGVLRANDDDDDDERRSPRGRHRFGAGVMSGDPRATSVVLWTRCEPIATVRPVRLRLEVALDPGFRAVVAREVLWALPRWDYTVRHKLTGLRPYTTYWYRFRAGADESITGRTRTAPRAGRGEPGEVRFAYLSCQDWDANHWATIEALAEEDVDFVVHLGDYIYESIGPRGAADPAHPPIVLPNGTARGNQRYATTLADYRHLYRTYRSDPRMQKLHARHPLIAIWDDHEFSNDAWQDHETYSNANVAQRSRRRAASQAWFENMPADVPFDADDPSFTNIRIWRDFEFGSLVHLVMTDERLYRSDHAVPEALVATQTGADPVDGDSQIGSRYIVDKAVFDQLDAASAAQGVNRSMLGSAQAEWWRTTMRRSRAAWRVWGNEVSLLRMQLDLRAVAPPGSGFDKLFLLNCDQWDGYPRERRALLGFLRDAGIRDVVAITGDIHAFFAGTVLDDFDAPQPAPVMVDLVTTGASSTTFFDAFRTGVDAIAPALAGLVYRPNPAGGEVINVFDQTLRTFNPWLRHVETRAIGYTVVSVRPDALVARMKRFKPLESDGSVPTQPLASVTEATVTSGLPAVVVRAV